ARRGVRTRLDAVHRPDAVRGPRHLGGQRQHGRPRVRARARLLHRTRSAVPAHRGRYEVGRVRHGVAAPQRKAGADLRRRVAARGRRHARVRSVGGADVVAQGRLHHRHEVAPVTPPTQTSTDPNGDAGTTYRQTPLRKAWAFVRNTWRGLTSMRTALILLFL